MDTLDREWKEKYEPIKYHLYHLGLSDDEHETMVLMALDFYLNNPSLMIREDAWVKELPTIEEVAGFITGFRAAEES